MPIKVERVEEQPSVGRGRSMISRLVRPAAAIAILSLAGALPLLFIPEAVRWWQARQVQQLHGQQEKELPPAVVFPEKGEVAVTIAKDQWKRIGLSLSPINPCAPRPPLTMDGVLYLDPDDYALIRTRFSGEIVEVPEVIAETPHGFQSKVTDRRPLRFGDVVRKGDLLAVVWSRDLGEKKSELAGAIARLAFDRTTLELLSRGRDSIPVNTLRDAERRVKEGEIAVERIEKTLRTWQLSTEEILQIRTELSQTHVSEEGDAALPAIARVDQWARVEIRSPIDGTVVEKNITVGTLVDTGDSMFKIANLNHLDVRAFAYEEDLVGLQNLPLDQRRWTIRLQGDVMSQTIEGYFDRIGSLIDPIRHTGLVMGWVPNDSHHLRPGQFITASVFLPDDGSLVSVPDSAIVDLDAQSWLLVQDPKDPERFIPTPVEVVRFHEGVACIRPQSASGAGVPAGLDSTVVSTGAVEILAEFQMRRKAQVGAEEQ